MQDDRRHDRRSRKGATDRGREPQKTCEPPVMSFTGHLFLGLLEGVVSGLVIALTAMGLSLVFGVMRIVNVAHGEFFMLGAVFAWYFSSLTVSFYPALVAAPISVALVALLADRFILRPIRYAPEPTIVATIGLLYILQQLVLTFYGPYARPVAAPIYFRVDFPWFGYSGYKLVVAALAALLLAVLWLVVTRTRLGLYMRATQQDRELAQAFGVPTERVYAAAFALGAVLAAIAGVLIVPVQQAHYLMGLDALLLSFMAVIIGGVGSLTGTLVAALFIGLIDGVMSVFFTPTLAKIVASLLVAFVLVLKPIGLFGEDRLCRCAYRAGKWRRWPMPSVWSGPSIWPLRRSCCCCSSCCRLFTTACWLGSWSSPPTRSATTSCSAIPG